MENKVHLSHSQRQFLRLVNCAKNTKNAKRKQGFLLAAKRWAVFAAESDAEREARKQQELQDWAVKQRDAVARRAALRYRHENREAIEAAFAIEYEAKQAVKRVAKAVREEKQRLLYAARVMRDTDTAARRAAKALRVRESRVRQAPPLPYA